MRIERFEDIEAWKTGRDLCRSIYKLTQQRPFAADFALRDQIRRAAISIMSNIAEGFNRGGDKEFMQFLATAKGSAAEVQAQLYVAADAGYLDQEQFARLYDMADRTARMIGGFMRYLGETPYSGSKYKNEDLKVSDEAAGSADPGPRTQDAGRPS